jgi:actin-related protein 8
VIVLHPGSRFLRIGKASDVSPITVLNVVARKCNPPVPGSDQIERISRPRKGRRRASESETEKIDEEYDTSVTSDDPVRSNPMCYCFSCIRSYNFTVRR